MQSTSITWSGVSPGTGKLLLMNRLPGFISACTFSHSRGIGAGRGRHKPRRSRRGRPATGRPSASGCSAGQRRAATDQPGQRGVFVAGEMAVGQRVGQRHSGAADPGPRSRKQGPRATSSSAAPEPSACWTNRAAPARSGRRDRRAAADGGEQEPAGIDGQGLG